LPDSTSDQSNILYVTYDGLTDPLGRSQVLPYLTGLAGLGHEITILSCEKPERMDKDGERIRKLCADAGLNWNPLKYHKKPPILSSALDAAALQRAAIRLHRERPFDIAHCRSYIPARTGLALKRRYGVKFLFDMRGFWPDEKVGGNHWNLANPLYAAVYRYFKRLESQLLRGADHIISLTSAAKAQLLTRPELSGADERITIIPCCVDFDHFPLVTSASRRSAREEFGLASDESVLLYLGSLGGNYLLEEMLDFFRVFRARNEGARFLFVTQSDPEPIRRAALEHGIGNDELVIRAASRDEVPKFLAAGDVGIGFVRPSFSAKACSPTKMGEMLAVGLPIVANAGVGDVEQMIEDMGCGVAIGDFTPQTYERALQHLESLKGGPGERRERALPCFDVKLGIKGYDQVYRNLLA
jgi:glycosyltransferase involved in cell wall biosynthesis